MNYREIQLPSVIAHRGASGCAPENTIAAFQKAAELGAKWVEFDVMLSRDKQTIVFHDQYLKRTTGMRGKVSRFDYQELAALDIGSWFAPEFKGELIPHFTDVIKCLSDNNLGANVEVKPILGKEQQTAEQTLEVLYQHWPDHLPTPLLSSFSLTCLRTIRSLDKKMPLGLLLYRWRSDWQQLAEELDVYSVHFKHRLVTPTRIQQVKANNRRVLVYTVNDPQQAKELFALGVDSVFTDFPDKIITKLSC